MDAEQLHRNKLKEIGYKDEAIEDLVKKFRRNGTYGFAEAYHEALSVKPPKANATIQEKVCNCVCKDITSLIIRNGVLYCPECDGVLGVVQKQECDHKDATNFTRANGKWYCGDCGKEC